MKKIFLAFALVIAVFAVYKSTSADKPAAKASESLTKKSDASYTITVSQSGKEMGKIVLKLYTKDAPKHSANFDSLVTAGAYNGTAFHRVIPNFMIQGGDPNSISGPKNTWGYGNPTQTTVPAEFSSVLKHKRGIISAARSQDPNSAASQFFICVVDTPQLDGQYSIFGEVISGMDIADKIVNSTCDKNPNSPNERGESPSEKITMTITKNTK